MANSEFITPSNKTGRTLGEKTFRAFLLAGERFITADMDRKDTLEEGFANFYKDIGRDNQKLMAGYFKKQVRLDLSQRALLLGDLTKLSIATPLELGTISPKAFLNFHALKAVSLKKPPVAEEEKKCSGQLRLMLNSLKVVDSQDEFYIKVPDGLKIWKWKKVWKNQTDEVRIHVTCIDAMGKVTTRVINLGGIREGRTGGIRKELCKFDLCDGKGDLPKQYSAVVTFIERDSGSYNRMLAEYAKFLQRAIDKELVKNGINAAIGVTSALPRDLMDELAALVAESLDRFVGWLAQLFRNEDEIMGEFARTCRITSGRRDWNSRTRSLHMSRHGGVWKAKVRWELDV